MHQWEYCYTTQIMQPGTLKVPEPQKWIEVRLCTLEGEQVIQTFPFQHFGEELELTESKCLAWLGHEGWELCGSRPLTGPRYFKRPKRG